MGVATISAMICAMGLYQGLNPAMGWLPAVERGFVSGKVDPLVSRAAAAAFGHCLAMVAIMVPLGLALAAGAVDGRSLQPVLGLMLVAFGSYKLWRPRHPAFLARIPPRKPVRWSFWMAATHCGSPIMMASALVALVAPMATGSVVLAPKAAAFWLYAATALTISLAMILPLFVTSCVIALILFLRRDLRAITKIWFNLDGGWAIATIGMGLMALGMSLPAIAVPLCRSF